MTKDHSCRDHKGIVSDENFPIEQSDSHNFIIESDLASRFNISCRMINVYFVKGLLVPAFVGPPRLYHQQAVGRLKAIRSARTLGFTLTEIRERLDAFVQKHDVDPQDFISILTPSEIVSCIYRLEKHKSEIIDAINALEFSLNQRAKLPDAVQNGR